MVLLSHRLLKDLEGDNQLFQRIAMTMRPLKSTFGISMKQKENLEYYAVINFISEYNLTHKKKLHFVRQSKKPPNPDTVCLHHKKEIGIEVAHTYGSGAEAAIRLGNRNSEDFPKTLHQKRRITPVDIRALNSLNAIMTKKATKTYDISPTWLLIRNGFPLWSLSDYRKNKKDIFVPKETPFRQIWLLCDENSVKPRGIMRII